MHKWIFALLAVLTVLISGCASSGGTAASSDSANVASNADLPEIAPYDDEVFEALPDMVAAE
jgi:hypothetical protein